MSGCAPATNPARAADRKQSADNTAAAADSTAQTQTITLGAGCFWCIEAVLLRIDGVESVVSGYMGGAWPDPTYKLICTGQTGHAEVVKVEFDPSTLPLDELLDYFWQLHDPTTLNRQGADVGTQYRSAIFYENAEQREMAEASKAKWNKSGKFRSPIVTEVTPASTFYRAEEYHQNFFEQNPRDGYCRNLIPPKLKKLGLKRRLEKD